MLSGCIGSGLDHGDAEMAERKTERKCKSGHGDDGKCHNTNGAMCGRAVEKMESGVLTEV